MPLCYDCRASAEPTHERWQYRTVAKTCDRCDSKYSHELIYSE